MITHSAAFSIEEGYRCTRELLGQAGGQGAGAAGPACTAIAAANDMLAIGCYKALEEAGLRCPEDLSVIGFNDMPFSTGSAAAATIAFRYQGGRTEPQLPLVGPGDEPGRRLAPAGRRAPPPPPPDMAYPAGVSCRPAIGGVRRCWCGMFAQPWLPSSSSSSRLAGHAVPAGPCPARGRSVRRRPRSAAGRYRSGYQVARAPRSRPARSRAGPA
jgi:hypothetical protein